MNTSDYLATVAQIHEEGRRRGVLFRVAEDDTLRGRTVRLDGRDLVSFSSCSYLGLEFDPRLAQGVMDAVQRYGTQFSSSRGYVSAPLYGELEEHLDALFGGYALVAPSTSLGHQMVLPVLATERDAIVVDNQAHRSLQMAATLARAGGATVETIRHRALDEQAVETVLRLARRHRTVYFACDGVYSMYGDLAPFGLLRQVLDAAPNVRLYVDDAHGMSWAGRHGRGLFLSRMPQDERIVLGTSLVKAFSAGGGVFVFHTREEREHVRMRGGPYVFSGPLQPPMMGAALASARIHLSDEIETHQARYRDRAALTNALLAEHGLPLLSRNEGPIFFLPIGRAEAAMQVSERLMDEGHYVTISTYPSVPTRRAGIRLTITALHTPAEIRAVVESLARHVPRALEEHGVSGEELHALFHNALPLESREGARLATVRGAASDASVSPEAPAPRTHDFRLEVHETAEALDGAEWATLMAGRGAASRDALRAAEALFDGSRAEPEHRWTFRYFLVRDPAGRVVAATWATRALMKDDMLSQERVSREVERLRREEDPYLLSSEVLMMGSFLSEGDHLYLDGERDWRGALRVLVDGLLAQARAWGVSSVVLRDLPGDDGEMDAWMGAADFLKVPQMDSMRLAGAGVDEDRLLAAASKRTRRFLRELVDQSPPYRMAVHRGGGPGLSPAECAHLHALYLNVAARNLRINVFTLPADLVAAFLASPAWEVVTLHLDAAAGGPEDGRAVAWYAAHQSGGHYAVFLCGVDYAFVHDREYGAYRQLLLAMTRRAREAGAHTLHWGMDAETEKARFGATAHSTCAYVLVRDHDYGERLHEIAREVALGGTA